MSKVILTIDDVPSKNTPALVDYLVTKGIPAVLFAVGQNVEAHYEEGIYALRKGIIIGNHTYSHPAFHELTLDACINEIQKTEALLNQLYHDAGVERSYRPFRFPYGDKGGDKYEALQTYLKEQGFHKLVDSQITYPWYVEQGLHKDMDTFWSFDFGEYQIRPDSEHTMELVFARIHAEPPEIDSPLLGKEHNHIILMHAHDETEQMVPEYYRLLLDYVMEQGVEFEAPEFDCNSMLG